MNNDEMIINILTEIKQSMANMEGKISNLESDVKDIKSNVISLESNVISLESDVKIIKRDVKKLHKSDDLILDEIERVHEIFDKKSNEIKSKIG